MEGNRADRAAEILLEKAGARFPGKVLKAPSGFGGSCGIVAREHVRPVLLWLRDSMGADFFIDMTAVDRAAMEPRAVDWRFSVLYQLASSGEGWRFRVAVRVPRSDPSVPSVSDLWPAARWAEREIADLFGIRFEGHPDPRRLLLPEEFPGYPLRKDFLHERTALRIGSGLPSAKPASPEGPLAEPGLLDGVFATPGAPRLRACVEGGKIVSSEVEIGFSHCGFEKLAESLSYYQGLVAVLRLSEEGALERCLAWAMAAERLLGIEPPPRAQSLRVILGEVSRIFSHIRTVSESLKEAGVPLGAASAAFRLASLVQSVMEAAPRGGAAEGVRLGGFAAEVSGAFRSRVEAVVAAAEDVAKDLFREIATGRSAKRRLRGAGVLGPREALLFGASGPVLRASGLAYDVRKAAPYSGYERYRFEIPARGEGDAWARILERVAEIRESAKVLQQALASLPDGPIMAASAKSVVIPGSQAAETTAGLIHRVKLSMDGGCPPAERGAEMCVPLEAPSGELSFYFLSAGETSPYRVHLRSPSFYHCASIPQLIAGATIEEARTAISSLGLVVEEIDR